MDGYVECPEHLLPHGVSAASFDPATLSFIAERHRRHPVDQDMPVKAWVVLWLLERARVADAALTEHYLTGVECDHERKMDRASCRCSMVDLGWHPSVGAAVESWARHVESVAAQGDQDAGSSSAG